jgi:dipeptidyl aminopeptidase/acylaminoacyl peptidase
MNTVQTVLDVNKFLALPRVGGLVLSDDGRRLITSVASLAPDGKRFTTALWEVDPEGRRAPERLTHVNKGAASPRFLPNGDMVFISARPSANETKPEEAVVQRLLPEGNSLWLLPEGGSEARELASAPGGIDALAVARQAGTVAVAALVTPGARSAEEDRARAKARSDAAVSALLFETYPVRDLDHWLGPREHRLFVIEPPEAGNGTASLHDLTPEPALDDIIRIPGQEGYFDLTPDGHTLVCGWRRQQGLARFVDLVAIDTTTADRRVLIRGPVSHSQVACSPDGRLVVCVRSTPGSPERAASSTLWLVELGGGESTQAGRDLLPDFEHSPSKPVWAPDSSAVYFTAAEQGRGPVWKVDVGSGAITRLSREGAFSSLCPSPDGARLYAMRSTVASPPEVVVITTKTADQKPEVLPTPGGPLELSTTVEETWTTASDGTRLRSWLVLPPGASAKEPAPLAVFLYPGSSWNSWHWRWNPHVLASRGYAVLMTDGALSVGYGQALIQRGWGRWGQEPYTDLMAAVDATVARPDIDAERTAAMGGSFGGYMSNWVATQTDRFRAIVTHASLWALDQYHGTTDEPWWLEPHFGDPYADPSRYLANSPHLGVAAIRTPMLVTHGGFDYRVPIGQALRLWTDLSKHGVDAKFLFFPDESHLILKPPNIRIWYQTLLAFLDTHVLGKDWKRPELL